MEQTRSRLALQCLPLFVQPRADGPEKVVDQPECKTVPTLNDVKLGEWQYFDAVYTKAQAASLGIPIFSAKAKASNNTKLIVRDYRRAKSCFSDDGSHEILYGQTVRAVIEITDRDVDASVGLLFLAAQLTIGNKSQQFFLSKNGIYNPKIDKAIVTVQGKNFNVENYSVYNSVMTKLIDLFEDKDTKLSVEKLLVIPILEDDDYRISVGRAYALHEIVRGKRCADVKSKFAGQVDYVAGIEATYKEYVSPACDLTQSSRLQVETVRPILGSVTVKKR